MHVFLPYTCSCCVFSEPRTSRVQIKLAKIMALVPVDRSPTLPRQIRKRPPNQLVAGTQDVVADSGQAPVMAPFPCHLQTPVFVHSLSSKL